MKEVENTVETVIVHLLFPPINRHRPTQTKTTGVGRTER